MGDLNADFHNHSHPLWLAPFPPNHSNDVNVILENKSLETPLICWTNFLYLKSTLNITQFCNFLCVGDFNIDFHNHSHPLYLTFCNTLQVFNLSQVVTGHTHTFPHRSHLLVWPCTSSPHSVQECVVVPPLANSDHFGIQIALGLRSAVGSGRHQPCARTIWHYSHADFALAELRIRETNWDELFSDDINSSWLNWQRKFLEKMEECIPRKVFPTKTSKPPMAK